MISPSDILGARRRLAPFIRPTPLLESGWLSERFGHAVWLKLESVNPTHSFKIRGAFNALIRIRDGTQTGGESPLVVTASAGNHGRALACAAERLGLRAVVFTPMTAPRTKRDAIRAHGARLHDDCIDYDAAEIRAREFAASRGAAYISPYNHPDVIAGAGTIGLEIIEECPEVASVVVPLGGGGLASGVGVAVRACAPSARIVGVEAEASTPFTTGLARGTITPIQPGPTLADGLAGNLEPGSMTFPLVQQVVDEVVTTSEHDIANAMRSLAVEDHLIAEGAAAVGAAALSTGRIAGAGPAVVLITGANVDRETLIRVLER